MSDNPFLTGNERPANKFMKLDPSLLRATKAGKYDEDIVEFIDAYKQDEGVNTFPVDSRNTATAVMQRINLQFKPFLEERGVVARGIQCPISMSADFRKQYPYIVVIVSATQEEEGDDNACVETQE